MGAMSLPQASKRQFISDDCCNNSERDQLTNDDNNIRPCAFDWSRRHSAGRVRSRFAANAWSKVDEEPEEMEQDVHNQEDNESDADSNQSHASGEDDQSYNAMVQYDLESVTKAQRLLSLGLSAARRIMSPRSRFQMGEDDDSFMNVRSPVMMRSAGRTPTPVSTSSPAIIKSRRTTSQSLGWADDQFTLYHEVLGFLETACASASPHVSITSDRLAQMQQLLQTLRPGTESED